MPLTCDVAVLDELEAQADDVLVDAFTLVTPELDRMVRRYVSALSRDPSAVDDLAQEVFTRALERIGRLVRPEDAGGFLRGISRHVVQEHFRARRRDRVHERLTAEAIVGDHRPIAMICHDRAMSALLAEAIAALPVVSRRLIEMRYYDGLDAAQIAQRLDISHAAVRVSLHRIRERLRCWVEQTAHPSI